VCNHFLANCNFLTLYLHTYINAHVQHLIYWQGQRVCDALFVVRESILCATLDWMWNHVIHVFYSPWTKSCFSIIIVTWKFCFPSVNSTIFLFRKCCHILDITEFRKKTPCPGPFIAYKSYILLFSRRLSLCLYHHGYVLATQMPMTCCVYCIIHTNSSNSTNHQ